MQKALRKLQNKFILGLITGRPGTNVLPVLLRNQAPNKGGKTRRGIFYDHGACHPKQIKNKDMS